jgi:molybdate transport system substrate-binding protein
MLLRYLIISVAFFCGQSARPETLNIAVASNFKVTLEKLIAAKPFNSNHNLKLSSGATGSLYTQIVNGAPFDIFLAADTKRPRLLDEDRNLPTGSRKAYAIGQLVLWVPTAERQVDKDFLEMFTGNLAIANPRTAPYGIAALSLLAKLDNNGSRLIMGENVAQAYQFVHTGNAQAGLVALSQVIDQGIDPTFYWQVPQKFYEPIEQQLVVLNSSPASTEFVNFLVSSATRNIISRSGYLVPGNTNRD